MKSLFEERLIEEIKRDASALQAPTGTNRGEVVAALQERAAKRRRRQRAGLVAVTCASLLTVGLGIAGIIKNQDDNTTVVSNLEDETLRLLPSWTPEGTTVVVSGPESFFSGSFATRIMVWGSADREVWVNVVGVGVGGTRPLEKRLQELLESTSVEQSARLAVDWSVGTLDGPGASVYLSATGVTQKELVDIARSLRINPLTLEVSVSQTPLGLPLRYAGDGNDLKPAKQWSLLLRGSNLYVSAEIPNELRESFRISTSPGDAQSVDIRGFNATLTDVGVSVPVYLLRWNEGPWTLSASGPSEAEVVRFARSLRPATKEEWEAVTAKPQPVIPRVPDPTSESFGFALANGEASVEMQLTTSVEDCVQTTLQLPGAKAESICAPISTERVVWSGTRTVGDRRFAVAMLANNIDAVTVSTAAAPKPAKVSSGEVGATWVEGAVVKSRAGQFVWLGWVVVEIPTGAAEVALDLYESEPSSDEINTTENPEDTNEDEVEDPNPISVDYPIRFIERVPID
jgi:hypothetical protein